MIQLLNGDCLELMKSIPDGSIDAIITDPPYGTTACKWDSVIDFTLMWEQLNRIIKPNGAIVLFGSEPFSSALRMSNIKNYKYDWVWEKSRPSNFANAKRHPMKYHEIISVFNSKKYYPLMVKGDKIRKKGTNKGAEFYGGISGLGNPDYLKKEYVDFYPKSIIKLPNPNNKSVHPTQKPVLLMEYLIKTYTNENETVLDFTMGSGSTGVAAKNLNRKFIGIEKDDNYFEIAKKRINEHQLNIF
jgi:site-specific DNA-methyltransferase (adenine-specific)